MAINAINTGYIGLQRGFQMLDSAAGKIAHEGIASMSGQTSRDGYATSLVELKQAEIQAKASTKVIQTEKDMIGSLLDVRA